MASDRGRGAITLLVEPNPDGHRFQAVADVAAVALRSGEVVLLTSAGARSSAWFSSFLSDVPIEVAEPFDRARPSARELAATIADFCRERAVSDVVIMDGDEALKRWWYVAAMEFRGLPTRPRVVFMLTRYLARVELFDRQAWVNRISKAILVLLAMGTRTLDRAGGFAGRDDFSAGWVVKRLRDPAVCSAHSRDRADIRRQHGLPADRRLVGIIGAIDARKSVPLVYDATLASGADADLLVAGPIQDDVGDWLDAQPPGRLDRMILRRRHLANDELDQLIAACDVVSVVQLNKGPSGIMGKALTAQVPVVTAGSKVRARELSVTGGGLAADMTLDSIAAALRSLYEQGGSAIRVNDIPAATAESFAEGLLGVGPDGLLPGPHRARRRRHSASSAV